MAKRTTGGMRVGRRAARAGGAAVLGAPAIMKVATAQTGGAFNWR